MQGDKVDEWCKTIGDFLDNLTNQHNIPALWDFFLQMFQQQFRDTQAYQRAHVDLENLSMKFPYIDKYVADFEKFIRKLHYTLGNKATNQLFLKGLTRLVLINVMQYPTTTNYKNMVQKVVESVRSQLTISNILRNSQTPH